MPTRVPDHRLFGVMNIVNKVLNCSSLSLCCSWVRPHTRHNDEINDWKNHFFMGLRYKTMQVYFEILINWSRQQMTEIEILNKSLQ